MSSKRAIVALLFAAATAAANADDAFRTAMTVYLRGDYPRALELLDALPNDPRAMTVAGTMHEEGKGTAMDLTRAHDLYARAAQLGYAKAQTNLANLLYRGFDEVPPDPGGAFRWYSIAAAQCDPKAQHNLAVMHFEGQGTGKDPLQAYKWLVISERNGDLDASQAAAELARSLSEGDRSEAQRLANEFRCAPTTADSAL